MELTAGRDLDASGQVSPRKGQTTEHLHHSEMQRGAVPFHFVLIKPTHYDDDRYPSHWLTRKELE